MCDSENNPSVGLFIAWNIIYFVFFIFNDSRFNDCQPVMYTNKFLIDVSIRIGAELY